MAKGNVVPARRLQRRIVRKEFDDRFIGTLDQLAIDRDSDQQGGHALRNRTHVVLGRGVEFVPPPFAHPPWFVVTRKILLENELAVAGDHHGMDIGVGGREPRGDAAQPFAVEADAFRRRYGPAIADRSRAATGEVALAGGKLLDLRAGGGSREHEESGKAEAPQSFATLAHAAISIP